MNLKLFHLVFSAFFCVWCKSCLSHEFHEPSTVVKTNWGSIEGIVEEKVEHNVTAFYGIPFAEPPVGDLRFREPRPIEERFNGVYNATFKRPACMQASYEHNRSIPDEEISEDCLYLNLWVPHLKRKRDDLLPVYFYVYGSQLKKSSATHKNNQGAILAALGNMIVVNCNYRLGPFGFMFGNDPRVPGNQGVYDILLALQWTRENIHNFGGNPNKITLGGSSSGSELAGFIALSPNVSPFLFDQLMMMSIIPIRPLAIESPQVALNKTMLLASKLGCGDFPNHLPKLTLQQIECMGQANASLISEIHTDKDLLELGSCRDFAFMPIYGEALMPVPTDKLLGRGRVQRDMKILIGSDKNDDIETENKEPTTIAEAEEHLNDYLNTQLKPNRNISHVLNHIYRFYFQDAQENDTYAIKEALSRLVSDYLFQCPILLFTEKWVLYDPIHLYYNLYTQDRYKNSTDSKRHHGAYHGDANWMFLGRPFLSPDKYSDQDREVSLKMIQILDGFVGNGHLPWPPVLVRGDKTLPLQWIIDEDVDPKKVEVNPKLHICRLWGKLYGIFD